MVRAFIKLNKQLKSLKQKQSCTKVYDFLKFSMTIFSIKKPRIGSGSELLIWIRQINRILADPDLKI